MEAKKATITDVVVCSREQIKATCSPTCPPSTASWATAPRWGCSGPGRSSTPRTERCRYGSLIYLLISTISIIYYLCQDDDNVDQLCKVREPHPGHRGVEQGHQGRYQVQSYNSKITLLHGSCLQILCAGQWNENGYGWRLYCQDAVLGLLTIQYYSNLNKY